MTIDTIFSIWSSFYQNSGDYYDFLNRMSPKLIICLIVYERSEDTYIGRDSFFFHKKIENLITFLR